MRIGTVKFFNQERGFGFIGHDDGARDIFVGANELTASGLSTISPGAMVEYTASVDRRGRPIAKNLALVEIQQATERH